jgi:hypothetical protein
MQTVLPPSEPLRRAVKWISERLREDEQQSRLKLVQEAVFRFNLAPKDENFLYEMYRRREE